MKKHSKKLSILAIIMMLATVLAGCGGKEVVMKEFKSPDETVTLQLDETWSTEDMGVDGWIGASNKSGTDAAIIMQFDKMSSGLSNIEEAKDLVESNYGFTDITETEKPVMEGVSGIEAYTCKMDLEGTKGDGYIVYGETDYAYYAFVFAANRMNDNKRSSFKASCESFKENAPEVENNSTVEATDTIRWFNAAYAVLTHANGWDYTMYGGMPANDSSMQLQVSLLEEWWGVTDRTSADETLEWLVSEGHNSDFLTDMNDFIELGIGDIAAENRADFLLENYELTEEQAQNYADCYTFYEANPEQAILGWDYSRAMSVLANCYLAGFYTETEALDQALAVAGKIQETFGSWEEFMESYFVGYEYWAEESSDERRALYEELKAASDNPYAVDFNLTLEKSW